MIHCKFKECPHCRCWFSLTDFLDDPMIKPIGMSFEDGDTDWNLYYFQHILTGCGTTFLVPVKAFVPLIDEEIPERVLAGSESCEHHCINVDDLAECQQPCLYAPFRRLLLTMIKEHTRATSQD